MLEGNQISRRTFLKSTGVVGTSALVAGLGVGSLMQPGKAHADPLGYLPYTTLDVDEVRKLAWKHYFLSGG